MALLSEYPSWLSRRVKSSLAVSDENWTSENEIAYTLSEKGELRFGLKCSTYKGDSWCCFDNFALYYQALPEFYDGIKDIERSTSDVEHHSAYDLSGRKVVDRKSSNGIVIRDGKKVLER